MLAGNLPSGERGRFSLSTKRDPNNSFGKQWVGLLERAKFELRRFDEESAKLKLRRFDEESAKLSV